MKHMNFRDSPLDIANRSTKMASLVLLITWKRICIIFRVALKGTMALTPLLGLTWIFGYLSIGGSTVVFQYIFVILNSLQGLFICIMYCALNREVSVSRECPSTIAPVITVSQYNLLQLKMSFGFFFFTEQKLNSMVLVEVVQLNINEMVVGM